MKKALSVMIPTLLLSTSLQATQEYKIMLGTFSHKEYAQKTIDAFPYTNSYIETKKEKDGIRYHAVIDYIQSKKEADQLLKTVQTKIKKAYLVHKKDLKKTTKKSKPQYSASPVIAAQVSATTDTNVTRKITGIPTFEENVTITTKQIPIDTNTTQGIRLKDAILYALKHSYKISAAREKVIQAKRKVDEKFAAYMPTVNLYNNVGGAYLKPTQAPEEKFLKSDESLVINQNIYAGGKHANDLKKERANLLAEQEKFKDKVEEETVKIIDSYLSLIYQKMSIDITRSNMKSLQKILDIVIMKEKSGAASKGDLNYIKSQVENASSALVKAESKYQNAIAFYTYYMGTLDESNMPIEEDFDFDLEDQETILEIMRAHNSKIQVAKAKMQAQKYNLQAQKSKFRPTIDLSITAKDKQSGYVSEPQEDRVTGLLSFNYNLYNGGKDKAKILGTKSKISELQYKLIDTQEGSEYNTKQLYENILSSKDSLTHTENEIQANNKVITSYWSAFKYGTQDIQALLLAQRALNRSQQDGIKERQAYTNGYFKLLQQTGTLLDHLGLQDFVNAAKIQQDKSMNYFW